MEKVCIYLRCKSHLGQCLHEKIYRHWKCHFQFHEEAHRKCFNKCKKKNRLKIQIIFEIMLVFTKTHMPRVLRWLTGSRYWSHVNVRHDLMNIYNVKTDLLLLYLIVFLYYVLFFVWFFGKPWTLTEESMRPSWNSS